MFIDKNKQTATEIVEAFEALLEKTGTRILCADFNDETQRYETNSDAMLYGTEYGDLVEHIKSILDETYDNNDYFILTEKGREKCEAYLAKMKAKRKEILDAGLDTADETSIDYTPEDLLRDVVWNGIDEDGDAWNCFAVTDHHEMDKCLLLSRDIDFV